MGGYADFAAFYDRLTDDVGYPQRADYIAELLMEHGMKKGIVLDLACGTGSLTLELSKRGYEMIGVVQRRKNARRRGQRCFFSASRWRSSIFMAQ